MEVTMELIIGVLAIAVTILLAIVVAQAREINELNERLSRIRRLARNDREQRTYGYSTSQAGRNSDTYGGSSLRTVARHNDSGFDKAFWWLFWLMVASGFIYFAHP